MSFKLERIHKPGRNPEFIIKERTFLSYYPVEEDRHYYIASVQSGGIPNWEYKVSSYKSEVEANKRIEQILRNREYNKE